MTDPKQQVTSYAYFSDDRLQSLTFTNEQITTADVSYTYDTAYGRIATMVDGSGTTTYGYHPVTVMGATQLASLDGPLTNDTITYTYDELGRVTSRAINGTANSVSWTFDSLGRVTNETNLLGTFTYTYASVTNRVATMTYPNGQATIYSYLGNSQDHRLETIQHKYPNGSTLSKFDYTYNGVGNILAWRQQADSNPAVQWNYGYDAADQLTTADKTSTGGTPAVINRYAYTYDPAGNRTSEQIDDVVTGASHNNVNELISQQSVGPMVVAGAVNEPATVTIQGQPAIVTSDNKFRGTAPVQTGTNTFTITATDPNGNSTTKQFQVSNPGAAKSFSYDANGNLTSDGTRTFEWDARNRLRTLTDGSLSITYSYDGFSRRIASVTKSGTTTVKDTKNVWCGLTLCEVRGAVGAPALTIRYQFALVIDGVPSYFTQDHLMSVREVTDSNGSLIARYDFGPWGERTLVQGSDITQFGFTGEPSSRTDIWSMTYRDYDATTARWLNEDPIGVAGGVNLYGYVQGNPLRRVDPSGLVAVSISPPQTVTTTSQAIGGGRCGVYRTNAFFDGGCKCVPGGFKADLMLSYHPQIRVAGDIMTPPEVTIEHELWHHGIASGIVNAAIRDGEQIERRLFSSYEACNKAVSGWISEYDERANKPSLYERIVDMFESRKCDLRPRVLL
jgi:RHS repeat-associated protein